MAVLRRFLENLKHPSGASTVFPKAHGCNGRDGLLYLFFERGKTVYF
ncbi:hypothetical protein NNO_2130 [Hydrogenimonas sp.]|nr:hypothetical protein NNO_2130 [Hydrogenimonas sp.]